MVSSLVSVFFLMPKNFHPSFNFNSHRATGASDYSQILRLCKNPDENNQTIRENIRILGLTASIVQTKCNLTKFNTDMKKLEENFW